MTEEEERKEERKRRGLNDYGFWFQKEYKTEGMNVSLESPSTRKCTAICTMYVQLLLSLESIVESKSLRNKD